MRRSEKTSIFGLFLLWGALFGSGGAAPAPQQNSATAQATAKTTAPLAVPGGKLLQSNVLTLDGAKVWVETGITLEPGQHVVVSAEGTLRYSDAKADNGPDGLARGFKDLLRNLPFNDAGRGALIGRVGDPDAAQPFLLGAQGRRFPHRRQTVPRHQSS